MDDNKLNYFSFFIITFVQLWKKNHFILKYKSVFSKDLRLENFFSLVFSDFFILWWFLFCGFLSINQKFLSMQQISLWKIFLNGFVRQPQMCWKFKRLISPKFFYEQLDLLIWGNFITMHFIKDAWEHSNDYLA